MSRIGKKPIVMTSNVSATINGSTLVVKGPKGEITKEIHNQVAVDVNEGEVVVSPKNQSQLATSLWGTFASHATNMVKGVTEGFTKKLIIEGVGYRAAVEGKKLVLQLGFSHPVEMQIPQGLEVSVEKNTVTITGIDKEAVGQFSADIREHRKPEPYKGKGIRYEDEIIRRKEGKKSA